MKFKDKVKILTDRGVFKEIKGLYIPYKDKTIDITLMAHLSEDAWNPDTVDVSEKSTGCMAVCECFVVNYVTLRFSKNAS